MLRSGQSRGNFRRLVGRGNLAACGLARYDDSRVRLSPAILRVLDELPLTTGTLVGEPGLVALLGPTVVVAGPGPLATIAETCLASVGGAILAAHPDADRDELLLEARARGAAPMFRMVGAVDEMPSEPMILVVADAVTADQLAIPRLA